MPPLLFPPYRPPVRWLPPPPSTSPATSRQRQAAAISQHGVLVGLQGGNEPISCPPLHCPRCWSGSGFIVCGQSAGDARKSVHCTRETFDSSPHVPRQRLYDGDSSPPFSPICRPWLRPRRNLARTHMNHHPLAKPSQRQPTQLHLSLTVPAYLAVFIATWSNG